MTTPSDRALLRRMLAMDTSTATMTVAVLDGNELLGEVSETALRSHSSKLVPAIQQLVHSLGMDMQEIDGIATGRGPGSYTGVRISVTVAKTFAWSRQLPLIGVSSLSALAFGAVEDNIVGEQWIIPLLDARRGQVYTGLYGTINQQSWVCHQEDHVQMMDDWIDQLIHRIEEIGDQSMPENIKFVGGVDAFLEQIERLSNALPGRVTAQQGEIRAYHVGQLAQQRWLQGEQDEVHSFVPNYAQLAEAEKKLLQKIRRN